MTADVPSLLGAASGAIPTLLLALVFQRPLLTGLVKAAAMYRAGFDDLSETRAGRVLLRIAPLTGGAQLARNADYLVIAAGAVGMMTSVALQAVPASEWHADGFWGQASGFVVGFHVVVVVVLASAVGAGLIVLAHGARRLAAGPLPEPDLGDQ